MKFEFKTNKKSEVMRMLKSDDMFEALFKLSHNAWRTLPEQQQQPFLDVITEVLNYYEINLDEMCED